MGCGAVSSHQFETLFVRGAADIDARLLPEPIGSFRPGHRSS